MGRDMLKGNPEILQDLSHGTKGFKFDAQRYSSCCRTAYRIPSGEFVNRTVDSCAGQAEGLSIVSFSCYCTIYSGSETAPADAVADPLLRPCFERSVFWGGVGVGERPVGTLALWELP